MRDAADAGCEDKMARPHDAFHPIRTPEPDVPLLHSLIVGPAEKLRSGPEVQLHALGIGLEPICQLVLWNEDWPCRRKRHVRQVVDVHFVVQRQRMIALAPIVADPRLAVDDDHVDAELNQPGRDGGLATCFGPGQAAPPPHAASPAARPSPLTDSVGRGGLSREKEAREGRCKPALTAVPGTMTR